MVRNLEKDQELRKERCEQILSAAVELFAKNGINATKISDIAAKAKMSHGLVYNYFRSKEDIYVSLLQRSLRSLKDNTEHVNSLPLNPYEKLIARVDIMLLNQREEAAFRQLFFDQLLASDNISKELKDMLRGQFSDNVRGVASIFEEGQALGLLIEGDPERLAYYYLSLVHAALAADNHSIESIKTVSGEQIGVLFKKR